VCNYALIKANIDKLPTVQLELIICEEDDNLPIIINNEGHPLQLAREFNFSDFNVAHEDVEASRARNWCARLYPEVFVPLTTTHVNCDNTEALRLPALVKSGLVGAPRMRRRTMSDQVDLT
jgi:hypothetical protein